MWLNRKFQKSSLKNISSKDEEGAWLIFESLQKRTTFDKKLCLFKKLLYRSGTTKQFEKKKISPLDVESMELEENWEVFLIIDNIKMSYFRCQLSNLSSA